jgi:hypothetical protein
VDKASADSAAGAGGGGGVDYVGLQTYKILKSVVGHFGVDSVLLTEGSILDHDYEIWNDYRYHQMQS